MIKGGDFCPAKMESYFTNLEFSWNFRVFPKLPNATLL